MSMRRRLADSVRRRLVPAASELEELRERVRTAESELAEARQRIRSLERELDRASSQRTGVADKVRQDASAAATPEARPEAAPEAAPASAGELKINEEECVGCGTCVDLAPDAFQMDRAAAVARVVSQSAPADQVAEAIKVCPTLCIHLSES